MIKVYILMMVVQTYNGHGDNLTTISAEFNSYETCEKARVWHLNSIDPRNGLSVISQGCFEK